MSDEDIIDRDRLARIHAAAELPAGLTVVDGVQASDPPPFVAPSVRRPWRRCRDLVDVILERAKEPWVTLQLGDAQIVQVRAGGIVLLIGGTGRGKTSLTATLLVEHAQRSGPALSASLELTGDEWTARAIGVRTNSGWASVLRGEVPVGQMLGALPERLAIIERDDASVQVLEQAIDELAREYPNEPILVAVDYVQLIGADSEDEIRPRIGKVMRTLDRITRSKRVVLIALSQGSRASSRALSSGEALGAATTDAGAESADLERWASVTLAIGQHGPEAADGSCAADLSIGKSRMGGGDRVLPARYHGKSGLWHLVGDARLATDVRAEREAERKSKGLQAASLAISALLAKAGAPMSRRDIRAKIGGTDKTIREAVMVLLDDPESGVAEVEPKKNNAYRVWLRSAAVEAGLVLHEGGDE